MQGTAAELQVNTNPVDTSHILMVLSRDDDKM